MRGSVGVHKFIAAVGVLFLSVTTLSLVSAAPNSPVVNTTISVEKTGSEPFNDVTWDGFTQSTAGSDKDEDNNVVRLQDSISYRVEVSVNDAGVDDLTASVSLLEKQRWIEVPSGCKTDSSDVTNEPVSAISSDGTILFCNLGRAVEGTTKLFFPTARVVGTDPLTGDVTLNDDHVRASVSAQADPSTNPSNTATDGVTDVVVTANFKVDTTKELKVSALDPVTNKPLYIAPIKTGKSPDNRPGSIIEYVVKARYVKGSMIADAPDEAGGNFESDYQLIDVYTDDNSNNNGGGFSTGGVLYDWDSALAACELVGDHGPNASISCSQLNSNIDDIGSGGAAPDGLTDPSVQVDLRNIDVRDPDNDTNLFEFKINIWFDKINDIDSHQSGSPYTDNVTNRIGTLLNASSSYLSGFNPVSTEDASLSNLQNYGGSGEPTPNEVSYPLTTSTPGSYVQHIAFTNLFPYASAKYPDQNMSAGETRPFSFNVYDYRRIDGAVSQSCAKIDSNVFTYKGLAPAKQTPVPSLYPWNHNQAYNPTMSTFAGSVGTTLRDGGDYVQFYFTNHPIINPVVNPAPTEAEWLEALRSSACNDDINGDSVVNIVGIDGVESNPGNPVDWWQSSSDVPGGVEAVTHVRHDATYVAAAALAQDPSHTKWAMATNHLIESKLLTTSPYGTDNRLPIFGSYRYDNGDSVFTGWVHAPANTTDPTADAVFGVANGMADRMTLVPASHAISKYTEPRGIKVVRGGDVVRFIVEPSVHGLWPTSINTARVSDNLPSGVEYVYGSEMFSIDGGGTWLSRSSYDALSTDVTLTAPANQSGDDPIDWEFGSVDSGDQLPLISYKVKVDNSLVSGVFDNTATILSDLEANNSQAYRLTILPEFGLDVVKGLDVKVSEINEGFEYELTYVNLGGQSYQDGEFIDILPFNGDGSGLTSGIASSRDPASSYSGSLSVEGITSTNTEVFYATDATPISLSNDPCHESNQPSGYVPSEGHLCYQYYVSETTSPMKTANTFSGGSSNGTGATNWTLCTSLDPLVCGGISGSDITALRFEVPTLGTDGGKGITIRMMPSGNIGGTPDLDGFGSITSASTGDVYTNSFAGRVPDISLVIISNDVSNTVIAAEVSGTVWDDVNNNGTPTNSEAEPALAGIIVNLLDQYGNPVLDSTGMPINTTTDSAGNYSFDQLSSGKYQVQVTAPGSGVQTYDNDGAGNNNSGIFDIFGPNNPDTSSGLTQDDYTDLIDVANVNFSYHLSTDIAVTKLVEGSDPDSVFTNSEILDIPTPGVPTIFQYQITVTNQSDYKEATGVVLTDSVTEGITITSVSSISRGSVTTPLPVAGVSPFGTSEIIWDIGTVAGGDTETLVINAEFTDSDVALFTSSALPTNRLNQNVAQITAMNEPDWDSTPGSHTIDDPSTFISNGSEDDEDDAFVFVPPTLGDYVWDDINVNGQQDTGEPGINGVTVNLYIDDDGVTGPSPGDSLFASTVTIDNGSTSGFYVFGNLSPSTDYWVEFDHSTAVGYTPTAQGPSIDPFDDVDSDGDIATGWTSLHNMASGEVRTSVDQGYISKLSVGNLVWFDENNNGVVDANEQGIDGVNIELYLDDDGASGYSPGDTFVSSVATSSGGEYLFSGLDPGDYVVRIPDIAGDTSRSYVSSTGVPTDTSVYEPATDPDNNLDNDDNATYAGSDGHVTGPFSLDYNTEPSNDGDTSTYTNMTIDLGFYVPMSIGNRVWLDSDVTTGGDGLINGSEVGIGGVTVSLVDVGGDPIDNPLIPGYQPYIAVTNAQGYYRFDGLTAGDYVVEVDSTTMAAGLVSSPGYMTGGSADSGDHGRDSLAGSSWRSGVVTLGSGLQPTGESDITTGNGAEGISGNNWSNLAIDFGFIETGDVSVSKSVDSATYNVGEVNTVQYSIVITNEGTVPVSGVIVKDNSPDPVYVSFTSWSCSITNSASGPLVEACSSASGTGDIDETVDLNPGGVATYVITAAITDTTRGELVNTATVELPGYIGQTVLDLPNSDSATVIEQLQMPGVSIDKSLYKGHDSGARCNTSSSVDELVVADAVQQNNDLTYCFEVSNIGSTHLSNLSISDSILGISESDMILYTGSHLLSPGATMTYYYETSSNTSIDNSATVTATPVLPDGDPTGQPTVSYTDSEALYIYVFDPPFGLKSGRVTDSGRAIVNWNMVWINDSAYTANNVIVTDDVPEGMTYEGGLVCTAEGISIVDSCSFEAPSAAHPRGRVVVQADIGPDSGSTDANNSVNELVISFDVTINEPDGTQEEFVNQASIEWDANNDGNIDFSGVSDNPDTVTGGDPSIVRLEELSETGSNLTVTVTIGLVITMTAIATRRHTSLCPGV